MNFEFFKPQNWQKNPLKRAGVIVPAGRTIQTLRSVLPVSERKLLGLMPAANTAAGIMGVKNCDKPEKAQSCLVMGVIAAILSVAGNVISNVLGSDFNIINYATGLIIPVLYIIGAVKNKEPA